MGSITGCHPATANRHWEPGSVAPATALALTSGLQGEGVSSGAGAWEGDRGQVGGATQGWSPPCPGAACTQGGTSPRTCPLGAFWCIPGHALQG